MKIRRFQDKNQFYVRVKDYLLSQEGRHNLLLGLLPRDWLPVSG